MHADVFVFYYLAEGYFNKIKTRFKNRERVSFKIMVLLNFNVDKLLFLESIEGTFIFEKMSLLGFGSQVRVVALDPEVTGTMIDISL